MTKFVFILTLFCILSAIRSMKILPRGNDFILGDATVGDSLLFGHVYSIPGQSDQLVSQQLAYAGTKTITRIRAIDFNIEGTGGFITQLNGGIGHTSVTLLLQATALGRGIDTFVDIYGK